MQYSYGQKARGIDYISVDGFLKAFRRLGHQTTPFYYDEYLNNTATLQQDLISFVKRKAPDLIFFGLYTNQFHPDTLDMLRKEYCTVAWFGDDTWRFDNYSKHWANLFSYCITTDKLSVSKYQAIGQNKIILSQWAAIDSHKIPKSRKYDFDVSFVGGFSPSRAWFISELEKRGISVATFGHGWKNGSLSEIEMNKLFGRTRINLNLSNSMSNDYRYLRYKINRITLKSAVKACLQSRFNPIEWIRRLLLEDKHASQIKARHFEIPFFGGFQLSYYDYNVTDYFIIGKEIVCFNDIDEAANLIKYYLEHSDERERIKRAGCKRSQKEHGYTQRLRDVLDQIKTEHKV